MKILFTLVAVSFIIGFTSITAAQSNVDDTNTVILVQSTLRNQDGVLITHLESSKFIDVNFIQLDSFLDFEASRGNDPIIEIDGKQFQIIRRAQSITFDSFDVKGNTILSDNVNGQSIPLAKFAHDGYSVYPGDTLESIWTFIRPLS